MSFFTNLLLLFVPILPRTYTVKIEVESPNLGTCLTSVWLGIQTSDAFDIYDRGVAATMYLERIAEDGNTGPISTAFLASPDAVLDGTAGATPLCAGDEVEATFRYVPALFTSHYLSYASMILPSNDAFVANGNPLAHPITNAFGWFIFEDFVVMGSEVLDAGTEVNDEGATTTAFFGQSSPNTGTDEGGTVEFHDGFVAGGRILSAAQFANADFEADGYMIMSVSVSVSLF